MSAVVTSALDAAIDSLSGVVAAGAPLLGSPKQAVALIDAVERTRRLAAVAAVDALAQIEVSRTFYEHGHANARVMFAHVAGVSGAEAHRLDKIRRMLAGGCDLLAQVWRGGELSVDKAVLLAQAYANPRTRNRFVLDQAWFVKQARRFGHKRFKKIVARWVEVHDDDGPEPGADPSHDRRELTLVQDHFSKAWKLDATLGSIAGSHLNELLGAYVSAEFHKDWAAAEQIHGRDTTPGDLARTDTQRRADALTQMAADAANSAKPSAPVKRVHNIVWTAETYEALLARWADQMRRFVHPDHDRTIDPDHFRCTDIDGNPIAAGAAFADSLISKVRRVVTNAAGVTLDLSRPTRLYTGLARLGVSIGADECYWPGCHVPTSRCQIDHLRPAARGGQTEQSNGLPACQRHNRFKERGYTVRRDPNNGTITINTPTGELIP